jgi:hypothetical protein
MLREADEAVKVFATNSEKCDALGGIHGEYGA